MFQRLRHPFKHLTQGLLALAFVALSLGAQASGGGAATGAKPTTSTKNYDYYLTGTTGHVAPPVAPSSPMLVLMGGGTDVDDAFKAMIAKACGSPCIPIDVVIIRATGADGYNPYLYAMPGVQSVETLVIKTRAGADDPTVNAIVGKADVLFIAGGDQWDYINLWKGSKLDTTLGGLVLKKVPLGGTSAGLAVLGQFDFSAQNGTITSAQAMGNPYDRLLTLDKGFINALGALQNTITDAHLVPRDRMGRLVTFLSRIIKDGWVSSPDTARAIGVDEQTALVVDGSVGTVVGTGATYFLRPTIAATTIKAKTALTMRNVQTNKLTQGGGQFDLGRWTTTGPAPYSLSVESGVLTSTGGGNNPY